MGLSGGRGRTAALRLSRIAGIAAVLCFGLTAQASAAPTVGFTASFYAVPEPAFGGPGEIQTDVTLAGTEYHGRVAPLTSLTLHMPAGTQLNPSGFPTCSETVVRGGNAGENCTAAEAGQPTTGTAIVPFASAEYDEELFIHSYFGGGNVIYLTLDGVSPVAVEMVVTLHITADSAPYGEKLVMTTPLYETSPGGPGVGITNLPLNLGATREEGGHQVSSVLLPSSCPGGKWPWAIDAGFNEASPSRVGTTESECPYAGPKGATTTTLKSSNSAPHVGDTVTYTAIVKPTSVTEGQTPLGFVNMMNKGAAFRSCGLEALPSEPFSSTTSCTLTYDYAGSYSISAEYLGDRYYLPSESAAEDVTVTAATEEKHGGFGEEEAAKRKAEEEAAARAGTVGTSKPTPPREEPPVAISATVLRAALAKALVVPSKALRISALLRHGGFSYSVSLPEAGALTIDWWSVARPSKAARASRRILVAAGRVTAARAGRNTVAVRLTGAGRRVLTHRSHIKLQTSATLDGVATASVGSSLLLMR